MSEEVVVETEEVDDWSSAMREIVTDDDFANWSQWYQKTHKP